ncbi:MAG: M50 family metallopeptidase [Candidatus Harrisonbacteria bacterium]|nr:M50 family metallopeptidase [Candidatus Harrisonbacteria bacterium]
MSILILIIGISALILLHELGHFLAAKSYGIRVDEFGFGFPPRLFSIKKGETEYSFNLLPFGGFVRLYGEHAAQLEGQKVDQNRSFTHQSARKRLIVIAAGVAVNFILGWLILSASFMIGASQSVVITQVLEDSPAVEAGLQVGDSLIDFQAAESFTQFANTHRGEAIEINISREGERQSLVLTPREDESLPAIGVGLTEAGLAKRGFFQALWDGLALSVQAMAQIIQALGRLVADIFGAGKITEGIVGPVGIFGVASDLGGIGFVYLLQLIGLISLNLAVLNSIPFPALDGGRFLFILIEKFKGSRLSMKFEMAANATGFILLLLLMVAITARDIIQLL